MSRLDRDEKPPALVVLVVEGSPLLRERLVWLAAEIPGVVAAAGVGTLAQAVARIAAGRVDAILLAADAAGWPDLGGVAQVRRAAPRALVAVLAAETCPELCERCVALGADLCLSRSSDLAALDAALRGLGAAAPHAAVAP